MNAAVPRASGADAEAAPPWACGLLAVDKPIGVTSHDVVDEVRRRLRVTSAGHLGTLDPGASGLLLIATGPATRMIPVWQGGEKTYQATLRFGVTTSTQDAEGEVLERRAVTFDEAAVREAALGMVGAIEQVPPMVSALKVGGERLYRLARRGITVERQPRRVTVLEWEWLEFAMPLATFRVRCSGGTYVRTLAHDLGGMLGSGASLESLRRLRSEPFGIERAVTLRALSRESPDAAWAAGGYPIDDALAHLPSVVLDAAESRDLGFGRRPSIARERIATGPVDGGPRSVVLRGEGGGALGLGELTPDPADAARVRVCPHVLMPWAVRDGREEGA